MGVASVTVPDAFAVTLFKLPPDSLPVENVVPV